MRQAPDIGAVGYRWYGSVNDENDYNVHVLHANTQGVMGGDLSGYFIYTDDNNTQTSTAYC